MPRKSVAKTTLFCLVLAIVILLSLMIFAGVFDRVFGIRGSEAGNVAWRKQKKKVFGHIFHEKAGLAGVDPTVKVGFPV